MVFREVKGNELNTEVITRFFNTEIPPKQHSAQRDRFFVKNCLRNHSKPEYKTTDESSFVKIIKRSQKACQALQI
ncbi:MAG: hypothetical protein CL926_04755 [Deltaproteobacteria bacterium]|nr:hypothetical protein [Deltaproteobacteria bacterium]